MIEYFLIFLVTIRVFTESVAFLPRFFNFIDGVIVFLLLALAHIVYKRRHHTIPRSIILLVGAFILTFVLSVVGNLDRVKLIPTIVFLILYFQPIVWYFCVVRAGTDYRRLLTISTVLFFVQVFLGLLVQVPQAIARKNPDLVSGTFGTNNSQMFFFVGLVMAFVISEISQGFFSLRKIATLFLGFLLSVFASFRAGLVIFSACLLLMMNWRTKAFAYLATLGLTIFIILSFFGSLGSYENYQDLIDSSWGKMLHNVQMLPKVRMMTEYPQVVGERPTMVLFGLGPATFMSRAYVQFVNVPQRSDAPQVDVTRGSVTRSQPDELSRKYFMNLSYIALFANGFAIPSASAIGPRSSYYSILYELGPLALVVYLSLYGAQWKMLKAVRSTSDDHLMKSFVFSAQVATLFLLGLAFFDDWFSITRTTTLLWTMFGVVTVEYDRMTFAGKEAASGLRS